MIPVVSQPVHVSGVMPSMASGYSPGMTPVGSGPGPLRLSRTRLTPAAEGAGSVGHGAGSVSFRAGSVGHGAGSVGLGTGSVGLGAGLLGHGAGSVGLGEGSVGHGTGSVGLGAGLLGLGAGSVGLGAGSVGLGAGSVGHGAGSVGRRTGSGGFTPTSQVFKEYDRQEGGGGQQQATLNIVVNLPAEKHAGNIVPPNARRPWYAKFFSCWDNLAVCK